MVHHDMKTFNKSQNQEEKRKKTHKNNYVNPWTQWDFMKIQTVNIVFISHIFQQNKT